MKSPAFIVLLMAAVLLSGFFLFKRSFAHFGSEAASGNNQDLSESSTGKKSAPTFGEALKKDSVATARTTIVSSTTTAQSKDKQKEYEEELRGEGYIDNPDDPYTLIKKVKKANGKESVLVRPKNQKDEIKFDWDERDKKSAEEVLESKKNLNPAEEISSLHRLDDNDQNSLMLLGKFRDDTKDVEIFFSPTTDEKGNPRDQDIICFVAPKLGYDFKHLYTGQVRTDETGYAILKLSENLFIRATWSADKSGRALHAQIYSVNDGQPRFVQSFEANEKYKSTGTALKYCD